MTTKQKLINEYPTFKDEIIERWEYIMGLDEFGHSVWKEEYKMEIPMTQKNIYYVIKEEIIHISSLEDTNSKYILDGPFGGLGITKEEYEALEKLSEEPYPIYGD